MSLIVTDRHSDADLRRWRLMDRMDAVNARRLKDRLERKSSDAIKEIEQFASEPCYLGVSWGKDSVVVAHLMHLSGADVPCVWVRVDGWENPDCLLVRDAFLQSHSVRYEEERVEAGPDREGGTSANGFRAAAAKYGDRYMSGIRADESRTRRMSVAIHGVANARVCRPIARWSADEVFAYLHVHDLPVHPAYGYSMDGMLDRANLRTASLGGERGKGHGRAEWERRYYG